MEFRKRVPKALTLAAACSLLFTACSKKDDQAGTPDPVTTETTASNVITDPVILNLQMLNVGGNIKRLLMPVAQIGAKQVNLKTVFDTGSEGMVLNASAVLPPEMISKNGIDLHGQSSFTVDGITITSAKDSASYGESPYTRRYYGQIAYATMVLGDDQATVTTRQMSIFLVYDGEVIATGAHAALDPDPMIDGICGVNNQDISNSDLVISRRQLKSPFQYLDYDNGISAGMALSAINTAQNADVISQDGNRILYRAPLLQVGLAPGDETNYYMQQQQPGTNGNYWQTQVIGTITLDGEQFRQGILFDTGTESGGSISDPDIPNAAPYVLGVGTPVSFSTDEGFFTKFTADKGQYRMRVYSNQSNNIGRSLWGLQFFTNHFFLIDYSTNQTGIGDM